MATLTINTTAAQDARIAAAFGARLRLGRDATLAEVRAEIIAYITGAVMAQERAAAIAAAEASITPVVPT